MAVNLRKDDGNEKPPTSTGGLPARAPEQSVAKNPAIEGSLVPRWEVSPRTARLIKSAWPAVWILAFIVGPAWLGIALLLLTGPVMAFVRGDEAIGNRKDRRRRDRELRRSRPRQIETHRQVETDRPAEPTTPVPAPAPATSTTSAAERSLAASLLRAETSGGRLEAEAVTLVRDIEQLLRPLLARVRTPGADAEVRRNIETIATEHLPAALDAYLALPDDLAHVRRGASASTPADELRSQLTLLLEGCRQLRAAVHDADLNRQQELSRFLDAKFRRSDLDL